VNILHDNIAVSVLIVVMLLAVAVDNIIIANEWRCCDDEVNSIQLCISFDDDDDIPERYVYTCKEDGEICCVHSWDFVVLLMR